MSRVATILNGIAKTGRVAGAYLFIGPPGVDKLAVADEFATKLGCSKQDRIKIVPDGASVKIEQIRELKGWTKFGPSNSPYLLVSVEGVDKLTDQAAAAFLKTLEEPAPGVVFVLLAEREDKILPTIKSRCQRIVFAEKALPWTPKEDLAEFYQELAGIKGSGFPAQLRLSARLEKEKERIEELLYELSFYAREKLKSVGSCRIILDSLRFIKRRANLKLTLDVMCLKLGGMTFER
ncbi:MAG: hypothetical protein ABIH69_00780 [bacterium]|nr:hypothetical protein [Candidatus Margulisiibacteriota bacterium]